MLLGKLKGKLANEDLPMPEGSPGEEAGESPEVEAKEDEAGEVPDLAKVSDEDLMKECKARGLI